jgi:hypothetical protein
MARLGVIIEGTGDAKAVGSIIHRSLVFLGIDNIYVGQPINAKGCANIDKENGLEKFVKAASYDSDIVLVVRDGDKGGTGPEKARLYAKRLNEFGVFRSVGIVVPIKEMENWFIASLESMKGRPLGNEQGLPEDAVLPLDIEATSGKGYFERNLPNGYRESIHQPLLAARFDPTLAYDRSCSYQKLCKRLTELSEMVNVEPARVFPPEG